MQSGKGLHAYGCALREPLSRHVQRADREHALTGESVGVGLGERTDVGKDVELLGRLDGVRVRRLLAGADDLIEDRTLALPLHQLDLAAVELEVALEVGDQVLDRAPEVLLRRLRDGVGLVAGQVADRGLEVLDVLDRDTEADPDLVLGDAAIGGAAVVLAGRPGDARRGVRVAGNLRLAVRAHAGGGRGGLAGAGALGVDRAGRTRARPGRAGHRGWRGRRHRGRSGRCRRSPCRCRRRRSPRARWSGPGSRSARRRWRGRAGVRSRRGGGAARPRGCGPGGEVSFRRSSGSAVTRNGRAVRVCGLRGRQDRLARSRSAAAIRTTRARMSPAARPPR